MRRDKSFQPQRSSPTQETSFFYKESSLSNNSEENIKNISVQVHRSDSDDSSEQNSYVSRISQQVFVKDNAVKKYDKMTKIMTTFFSSVSKQRNNTKL